MGNTNNQYHFQLCPISVERKKWGSSWARQQGKENDLSWKIIRQAEELYKQWHNVLPWHKALFYSTLEEHEEMEETSRGLQQCINTWGPLLWDSLESTKKLGVTQIKKLTEYFTQIIIEINNENISEEISNNN